MRLNITAIVVMTSASSFNYLVSLGSLIANIIKKYCSTVTVFVAGVKAGEHSAKMYITLSIMTLSIMTLGTMTLSITK